MKPAPFAYHAPKTLEQAVAVLAQVAPEDGRVLAGGQSLVPTMAFRLARPAHLVDINQVAGLDRLAVENDALAIGACGGSLAHADPASEWCLVAATLGGEIAAKSARGTRKIAAADFFQGLMATALKDDELLEDSRLPVLAADTRWGFYEFSRRAGDYALAMALATFRLEQGVIVDPRVGLGGVEVFPRRIPEAEAVLTGKPPEIGIFRRAAEAAADVIDPLEDIQASAEYRRDLVRAVARRALERAAA